MARDKRCEAGRRSTGCRFSRVTAPGMCPGSLWLSVARAAATNANEKTETTRQKTGPRLAMRRACPRAGRADKRIFSSEHRTLASMAGIVEDAGCVSSTLRGGRGSPRGENAGGVSWKIFYAASGFRTDPWVGLPRSEGRDTTAPGERADVNHEATSIFPDDNSHRVPAGIGRQRGRDEHTF